MKAVTRAAALLLRQKGVRALCSRGLLTQPTLEEPRASRYARLPGVLDNCFLTYVWIDGSGQTLRSKQQTVPKTPASLAEVKDWGCDGSSTGQAEGHDSDMLLRPAAMCKDPFFPGPSRIVLCDVYNKDGSPARGNQRAECAEIVEKCAKFEPWFGMEQEYTMMGTDGRPLGFPPNGFPPPQGRFYCSVGSNRNAGRELCDAHYLACTYAGLNINGTNAEVLLGQWEYQIGPSLGISVADDLWLARYIMERMGEEFGVAISLDPKPVPGDWNGTGNHANFSTKAMRADGGLEHIWAAIKKLERAHDEHIRDYDPCDGVDNARRLTGLHETASIKKFTAAAGSRNVSVRIPRAVAIAEKGWLEDRRPSANCDPYKVVSRILNTVCL